jgi:hypothetical protein
MHSDKQSFFEIDILFHALEITAIVFVMMLIIDWVDVQTRGKIPKLIANRRRYQYLVAGFLGITPGCMGAYMNVSLYMHGYLSLGAIVGGMIATNGEASLVMFAQFPRTALILHIVMFFLAIAYAAMVDQIVGRFQIKHQLECESLTYHDDEKSIMHYIKAHIWQHIIKKHTIRIFLWTFFAIWLVHLGMHFFDIATFAKNNPQLILLTAVLVGIIPDVAPQFIFVFMYSQGLIPFSILLTSSIVQNGHAMLPLLSYSIRDTIIIKTFNVVIGLIIGLSIMAFGL